ncbi:MAG: deoxyribodipyrimidine photo-lyase, partial [Anaerolineales bacterium]
MNTIWWIRRDLRLHDNQAFYAAYEAGDSVVPVFILDPNLLESEYVGDKRLAFLFASLRELAAELEELGSRLIIRQGNPKEELKQLLQELDAQSIYAEEDFSPYSRRRDDEIKRALDLHLHAGLTVFPPG